MPDDENARPSFFAHKFTITASVKTDPVWWNKEWDKALHPFSARDVCAVLSPIWLDPSEVTEYVETLKDWLGEAQNVVAELWADIEEKQHFVTAWLLLEERSRQTHLLKGLEEACKQSSLGVDARAMCPDIKINSMLKRQGKAYMY